MSTGTTMRPMMDCAEFERSVDAFLDEEFEPRERAEAEIHLTGCPRCDVTLEGAVASGACPGLRVANLVDLLAEAVC